MGGIRMKNDKHRFACVVISACALVMGLYCSSLDAVYAPLRSAYFKRCLQRDVPTPVSGVCVIRRDGVELDTSGQDSGYVRIRCMPRADSSALRVWITAPNDTNYIYDIGNDGVPVYFLLSEGPGNYDVSVYYHTRDSF